MVQRNRWFSAAGAAAVGVFALTSIASAEISTEKSGSIVIFPKVVWDGARDTIIQITNTGNVPAYAHCFYVNASEPGLCQETDFEIFLTKQQPTQWAVSTGRRVNFFDGFNNDGSGIDPGLIPPVPEGFDGELKCIQTNDDRSPLRANSLKGEATLISRSGDASKYNAIALQGNPFPAAQTDGTNTLVLDHDESAQTGEYDACPNVLVFNHFAQGAPGLTAGVTNTMLTLVPCSQNLETGEHGVVTVQFETFNEFEQPLSSSMTIDCFLSRPLDELSDTGVNTALTYGALGTISAYTRIQPIPGDGAVIGVAEEMRVPGFLPAAAVPPSSSYPRAAYNLTTEGNRFLSATDTSGNPIAGVTDRIVVPQN
jgi:hypothetical protein